MPNEIEAYRSAFEHKRTNGFTTTVDMNARDFATDRARVERMRDAVCLKTAAGRARRSDARERFVPTGD